VIKEFILSKCWPCFSTLGKSEHSD
jgi:hypothetical protein